MNFDFSKEQYALQEELRTFLSERSPVSACRKAMEGGGSSSEIWGELAELGWLGLAIPEQYGGTGLGPLMLALAAQEFGRVLAPVPFVTAVCGVADLILRQGSDAQKSEWLPAVVRGEAIGTLAWSEAPGCHAPDLPRARFDGHRLAGRKVAVPDGASAHFAIVSAASGSDPVWTLVRLDQPRVRREAARSIDPSRPVAALSFENADAELLGSGSGFDTAMLHLASYVAFEQLGGADAAFGMTREYMGMRKAFGKPIASYQAIKHRAADVYTAIELARAHAFYAAWAISSDSPEIAEAACSARIAASRAFELTTTEAIQMHGGIGFTWESDCHLFHRRARWLGSVLGSVNDWYPRMARVLGA